MRKQANSLITPKSGKPSRALLQVQREASEILLGLSSLTELVDTFLVISGVPWTRLGREALNQQDFVRLLHEGRSHRIDTVKKVLSYIATFKT